MRPYEPEPPETFRLRRLICHPWFPPICIALAVGLWLFNEAAKAVFA